MKPTTVGRLREIVGNCQVLTEGEAFERRVERPASGGVETRGAPDAVVMPADAGEVAGVLALAAEEALGVRVRGGGTGLWAPGRARQAAGTIVVSTERLTAGPEFHGDDLYATVGAGVAIGRVRTAAEAVGLLCPIDPASEGSASVGGSIAAAAVGMHGIKYGGVRNYVLGLELASPQGRVIRVGGRTVKNVAGYDVTRLCVGSRGALGVVTSATLKLLPLPQERRLLGFGFPDAGTAAEAAGVVLGAVASPAALELMDGASLAAAGAVGEPRPEAGALLLVELDGARSRCAAEAAAVKEAVAGARGGVLEADVAYPAAEQIWALRRSVLAGLAREAGGVRLWSLRVAPAKLPGLVSQLEGVSRRYRVRFAAFGHAAEGLMHLGLAGDWTDAEWAGRADFAVYRLASLVEPLGVTLAEGGGVGCGARVARRSGLGPAEAELTGRIKSVFDPAGIMESPDLGEDVV